MVNNDGLAKVAQLLGVKRTKKKNIAKRLGTVEAGFTEIRTKQNKMAFVMAQNQAILDERTAGQTELILALFEILKSKFEVTDTEIARARSKVITELEQEAFDDKCKKAPPKSYVCRKCHQIVPKDAFLLPDKNLGDMIGCPVCSNTDDNYEVLELKEEIDDSVRSET